MSPGGGRRGTRAATYLDITLGQDTSIEGVTVSGARILDLRKRVLDGQSETDVDLDEIRPTGENALIQVIRLEYRMVSLDMMRLPQAGDKPPLATTQTSIVAAAPRIRHC